MFPILLSIGPITIYTINVVYVFSWCVFSFVFWRYLRRHGVLEERIFDATFYGTLFGIIFARLGFVFLYPHLFTSSILLIGAVWVQPGLWIYAGVIGMFLGFFIYTKRTSMSLSHVFDAGVIALIWMFIALSFGFFLHGEGIGRLTELPWGIRFPGIDGSRHPVQIYEGIVFFILSMMSLVIMKKSFKKKWEPGLLGTLILTILTPLLFVLEFFKESPLYLYGITINQWLFVAVFAESFGFVCSKGGVYAWIRSKISRSRQTNVDSGKTEDQSKNRGTEETGSISRS
ncbi:MAG: prolipoprotein diacylglyceryl transferase [Patescibacteria group bacterium]|nr:prolipoprotein diacylglyceryl transferase [Patescibacteria group bacterium]